MRIERVRSSDAGKYKISTRNSEGEGHFSFRLKVKGVYNLKPHAYIQYMSIIVISCTLSLSLSLSLSTSLPLPIPAATHGYEQSDSDEDGDPSEW